MKLHVCECVRILTLTRRVPALAIYGNGPVCDLGALLGEWLLRGVSKVIQLGVPAFTAGIILTRVESQIIPETFEKWEGKVAAIVLTASFAGFAMRSTWLS